MHDPAVLERTLALALKVDEFALLLAGEGDEEVALLLLAIREELGDAMSWSATELFVHAVRRRLREIERNVAGPVRCQ
jgi:hypothetical protein